MEDASNADNDSFYNDLPLELNCIQRHDLVGDLIGQIRFGD